MKQALTDKTLYRENCVFRDTGGVSSENRSYGFRPAFLDTQTGVVYDSCHPDGKPAPCHLLDGLPQELVTERHPSGRVAGVKGSIIAGFVQHGRFYDRAEAAKQMADIGRLADEGL